jgi:hypothetical protein
LSPEEWRFSGPLALRATPFSAAWRNNADALHSQKSLKGMEPGEMLPLTLRNREENSTCEAKLNKILT